MGMHSLARCGPLFHCVFAYAPTLAQFRPALADAGANAYNVKLKYLPRRSYTFRLVQLSQAWEESVAWHHKCNDLLSKEHSYDALLQLVCEGDRLPIQLDEVSLSRATTAEACTQATAMARTR